MSYLLAIRNPISVIRSLAKRDQFDLEKSALLWLTHTVSSLEGTRGERSRTLIDYDRLIRAPEPELYRVIYHLKLQVDPNELQIYLTQFLDEKLRHTTYDPDDLALSRFTESFVRDLYSVLLDAASGKLAINAPAVLQQLARSLGELDRWEYPLTYVDSLYHFKRSASQEITTRDAQIRESQAELAQIGGKIFDRARNRGEAGLSDQRARESRCRASLADLQELNARLERTEGELVRERQAVTHYNSTITALEKVGAERASQIQELNARLERTDGELVRERQAVAHCNSTISALEGTIVNLTQQVEGFQVRFERTQGESILEASGGCAPRVDE